MVMAAGLGTRLRPLTYEVPKPLVPVANRPVIAHILRLLATQGFDEVIANVHWFAETVTDTLGDGSECGVKLSYRHEEELLGTAGGVRNVADFLTEPGETFVVLAGDALTDVDLNALVESHHRHGGVATLACKRATNVSELGVVVTSDDDRVIGFQEKPDPAEALSDLANCMMYAFSPEAFDYFPSDPVIDFAKDVFPAMLENDVPFHVHVIGEYWNDVGSLDEFTQGNLDVVEGLVGVDPAGELIEGGPDEEHPKEMPGGWELSGRALLGEGAEIGAGAKVDGPAVIGTGAKVGEGARIRHAVLLDRAEVPANGLLAGGIAGRRRDEG
jgi:mannose-1-phosphate guanylyltransferase/mannose-1-phosphate guanylyltransferase/phosphomannomutase